MARALHEPIPLRESSILGDFEESFTLAHVYGDLTQSPVLLKRLSPTEWFLADHAVQLLAGAGSSAGAAVSFGGGVSDFFIAGVVDTSTLVSFVAALRTPTAGGATTPTRI